MTNKSKNQIVKFKNRLPAIALCADKFPGALQHKARDVAATFRHVQANSNTHLYYLTFDIDHQDASMRWYDCDAPAPNFVCTNLKNGHAHYLYSLKTSIRTATTFSSIKAIRYADAVTRGLSHKLKADACYTGLIVKNPLHSHWRVAQHCTADYTLEEIARHVDLNLPPSNRPAGLGRNCDTFDAVRHWAYKAIRQGYPNYDDWLRAVDTRVHGVDLQRNTPRLSESERRSITKSIARWVFQRFSKEGFAEVQAARGRKGVGEAKARGGRAGVGEAKAKGGRAGVGEAKARGGKISKGGGRKANPDSETQLKPWEALGVSRRTYYRRKNGTETTTTTISDNA